MAERGPKIRRVDFCPDEYLTGVSKLTAEEQGVYWGICSLIYSHGGPIDDDLAWLCQSFRGMHWRTLARILDSLATKHGKIIREGCKIASGRCMEELDRARHRVVQARENGAKGGRPSGSEMPQEGRKEGGKTSARGVAEPPQAPLHGEDETGKNKDLPKAPGSSGEKLTTNYQLPEGKKEPPPSPAPEPPKRKPRAAPAEGVDAEFEEFYAACPRRVDKAAAKRAYVKARKSAEHPTIMAALAVYRREVAGRDPEKIKHPSTWLNAQDWSDPHVADPPSLLGTARAGPPRPPLGLDVREIARQGADPYAPKQRLIQ